MGETTATKAVLAIGIDPAYADLSALPGFTPEMVRAYLQNQIDRINEYGHEAVSCLIDTGATAEGVVEAALCSRQFDCVVIGAGLREPPELLLLFEKVLNVVHRLAPSARIAFNASPTDTAEAAQRWLN